MATSSTPDPQRAKALALGGFLGLLVIAALLVALGAGMISLPPLAISAVLLIAVGTGSLDRSDT